MCEHMEVTIYSRLWAMQTLYEPEEYTYKAQCEDCGEWMDVEDVPEDAEVHDG